jgi:hypothetical protein
MHWKTIHMLIKNERSVNTMPPLRDRDNNFNLSYDCLIFAYNNYFACLFKLLTQLRCFLYCFSVETVLVLKNAFQRFPGQI